MKPGKRQATQRQNIAVEYSATVLDEIRARVLANFESGSHGGIESAGVLFGTRSQSIVTVSALRPAACSNSSGSMFVLGPGDHRDFEVTARLHQTDPALAGLEPVGWFLSHVRDSLEVRPSDREIYDRYFDQNWQIVLIMRPGTVGSLRAATFGRGNSAKPVILNEFIIKQSDGAELPLPAEPEAAPSPASVGDAISPQTPPPGKPGGKRWQVMAIVAGAVVTAGLAASVYQGSSSTDGIALEAFEREGVMQIEWNPNARSVSRAVRGQLEIIQGGSTVARTLTREDLRRGLFATLRKQDEVSVRLRLYDAQGDARMEQARYIGRPLVHETPPVVVKENPELRELRRANEALKSELSRERQRAVELERRVKVQQTIIQRRDGK